MLLKAYRSILFVLTIISISFCKKEQTYKLNWNINKNDKLVYKTILDEIDTSEVKIGKVDTEDIYEELISKFKEEAKEISTVSILKPNIKDIIDIEMISYKDYENDTTNEVGIWEGILLRGKVNKNGRIESFYLNGRQKNLLALLFELPQQPVKIGDVWPLEVNFATMDQNFVCKDFKRKNTVKLVAVKKVNGNHIAILKYDIMEFVEGIVVTFGSKDSMTNFVDISFKGNAEFNINKGKWIKYNGIMKQKSKGFMSINQTTLFSLQEIDKIPENAIIAMSRKKSPNKNKKVQETIINKEISKRIEKDFSKDEINRMNSKIFISSLPPMADVFMDNKFVGKANIHQIKLFSGSHKMTFKKGNLVYDTTMVLEEGLNPSTLIRLK